MAILTKGQTFADGDSVTSTKLNNLVDAAAFVSGASGSTDDSSLEVNGSGRLQVKDSGISSAKIAASAVTTAKLPNSTLATDGVTYAKLQRVANMRVIGNTSGALAVASEVSILDEDDMASDSATALATQQSIKAYTDTYVASRYILETEKTTTSGTIAFYTGIPSWVKRITVMLDSVSTNGSTDFLLRIGDSGGVESTGYVSNASDFSSSVSDTTGFILTRLTAAAYEISGTVILSKVSGNKWVCSGNLNNDIYVSSSSGIKTLSGTLDRVQLTTVGGDTFDNGSFNISYE